MFRASGLAKSYGDAVALQPIDLTVVAGQTVAVIGPSGGGKSTLLRLLAGLDAPSSGRIDFDGTSISPRMSPETRRRIGYVVQGGGLFPHLTAEGNATIVARHLGWDAARREARLTELCDLVRLPRDVLLRYPVQLSGGQAQRVALMRALFLDPEALLMDEPLGALDPITRHDLQQDLRAIFTRLKKTVVLVTHDLGEAVYFADRILLVREGRVIQDAAPDELLQHPANDFVAKFISAQRSPLEARVSGGGEAGR